MAIVLVGPGDLHHDLRNPTPASKQMTDRPSFVWVRGMSGPVPQKWSSDVWRQFTKVEILAEHKLSDEEWFLPIDQLAVRYPAPVAKTEKVERQRL